jgi:hypothetical protein
MEETTLQFAICQIKDLENLLEIYNNILRGRVFPDEWKECKVSFIPKMEKMIVTPISVASCVFKILDRMINVGTSRWLEKNHKL